MKADSALKYLYPPGRKDLVSEEDAQKIVDAFERAKGKHNLSRFWKLEIKSHTAVEISNASEWDFDEMKAVSEAFGTDSINVVTEGCGTCGHGATIHVSFDLSML